MGGTTHRDKGARGVGKTTLILQYIKKNIPIDQSSLYVSLDNIWFADNTISSLVDQFVKQGGKFLFLDEVHKYPNWSQELKNIYDDYPNLKLFLPLPHYWKFSMREPI